MSVLTKKLGNELKVMLRNLDCHILEKAGAEQPFPTG
jgi:hypothetical protein